MKKVKIITIVLAIILVTAIAFAGVYIKTQNRMESKIKDYNLGRELKGGRIIEIKISDGTAKKDEEKTESTSTEKEEEKIPQDPEILTVENYEIVKKTIEKRLNNLGAQDYIISLNKENGTIRVELAEDNNTDMYAYFLTAMGKVEITDKDTGAELVNDSMVKKASYNYTTDADGKYQVYLDVILSKEGQAKIEEISNEYALLANEIDKIEEETKKETEEESKTEENTTDGEVTENTNIEETTQQEQNNEEKENRKKIAVLKVADTERDIEKIEKNKLTLKIGSATTNTTTVNNSMSAAAELAMLINSGKYPVEYEIQNNRYTHSDILESQILYFALIVLAIIVVTLIIYIIKYKTKGLLSAVAFIGFISVFSLLLRYTNTLISIEGMGAIILTMIINLILNNKILDKIQKMNMVTEAMKNTYKELFLTLIPVIIISIVFCFSGWSNLISFGIVMFWGLILIAIYNITVTNALLRLKENK